MTRNQKLEILKVAQAKAYPRSVGEIIRAKNESYLINEDSQISTYQVAAMLSLTIIETYFPGMVGESICCHSYHTTDYRSGVPIVKPINSIEELKELYKHISGRKMRITLWYYIKNFNGWSEDPLSYIQ